MSEENLKLNRIYYLNTVSYFSVLHLAHQLEGSNNSYYSLVLRFTVRFSLC